MTILNMFAIAGNLNCDVKGLGEGKITELESP